MKKYLTILLLGIGLTTAAQTSGIRVGATLPVTEAFRLGAGSSAEWWMNWPLQPHRQLHLALGVQHYAGYQAGIITQHWQYSPLELIFSSNSLELNALTFASLQAGYRWESKAPWAYTLGARVGYQFHSEGFEARQQRWVAVRESSHDPLYPDLNPGLEKEERRGNSSGSGRSYTVNDHLRRYDAGLLAVVHYRITRGLEAEASYYQGFFNQWAADFEGPQPLRASAFSLGLALRLF